MKQTVLIIASGIALLLLLGGAAFVGGRLLAEPEQTGDAQPPVGVVLDGEQGFVSQEMAVEMEMAAGLPEAAPDVSGIFQEREDNSILIGTGDMVSAVAENEDGTVDFQLSHTGPVVEVVVTGKTEVYRDVTEMDFSSASGTIQQKVEPGSIDEIGADSMVMVWGQQTGDRVVAQVLLYSMPQVMVMPGPGS